MITTLQNKLKLSKKEQQFALYYILDNQKLIKSYINKLATAYTIQQQYQEIKQEISRHFQFLTNILQSSDKSNSEELYQIATSFYAIQQIVTAVVKLQIALRNILFYPINIENFKLNKQRPFFYGLFSQEFISLETIYALFNVMGIINEDEKNFFDNIIQHNSKNAFQLNLFLQKNKNQQINQLQQKIHYILVSKNGKGQKMQLLDQKELISYSEYQKLLKEEQQQLQKIDKLLELNKSFKNEYCKIPVTQNGLEIVQQVNMTKINIINQTFREMNIQMDQIDDEELAQYLHDQGYRNNIRKKIHLNYLNGAYSSRHTSNLQKTQEDDVDIGQVLTLQQQQELAERQSLLEQQELEKKRQEEIKRLKELQRLKIQQEYDNIQQLKRQEEEKQKQLEIQKQRQLEIERKEKEEKEAEQQRLKEQIEKFQQIQKEKEKLQKLKEEAERKKREEEMNRIKKLQEEENQKNQKKRLQEIQNEILMSLQLNENEMQILQKLVENMTAEEAIKYLDKIKKQKELQETIQQKKEERQQILSAYKENKNIETLILLNKKTRELAEAYYQLHECTKHLTDEEFSIDKNLFNNLLEVYKLEDIVSMIKEKLSKQKLLDIPPYALDMIINHEFITCDDNDKIKENFLKFILQQYDINSKDYLDYIIQQFYEKVDESNGNQDLINHIMNFEQKFDEYYDKVLDANQKQQYILTVPVENEFQVIDQNGVINPVFQQSISKSEQQQQSGEIKNNELANMKQELNQLMIQKEKDDNNSYKTLNTLRYEEETNEDKFLVPQFYTYNVEQIMDEADDIKLQGLVDENSNIYRYFIIRNQDKHFERRFTVQQSIISSQIILPKLKSASPDMNQLTQPPIIKQRHLFCCAPPILK